MGEIKADRSFPWSYLLFIISSKSNVQSVTKERIGGQYVGGKKKDVHQHMEGKPSAKNFKLMLDRCEARFSVLVYWMQNTK